MKIKNNKGSASAYFVISVILIVAAIAIPVLTTLRNNRLENIEGVIIDKIADPSFNLYHIAIRDSDKIKIYKVSAETFYDERVNIGARLPIMQGE